MSGNARGKLKEHCEGIHRNFDWSIYHCTSALALIGETHPDLKSVITALATQIQALDSLLLDLYKTI